MNELSNVYARHAALGDAPGTIRLPKLDYGETNNFGGLSLHNPDCTSKPCVSDWEDTVQVETIDSLHLDNLRFIKADVEGMEIDVLKGGYRDYKTSPSMSLY